jgi:hybrid polyketide synthase/nonribosomal peptide synthetase ACE1
MVLDDEMIEDMTIEAWEKACRPKVRGSVFLDKYFNTELEFFILFSSIVATHGNEGQANYGAGNMFSTGLAFNRRLRGLRASVLHIGPIAGAGYIIREATHIVENRVLGRGHMLLSQTDFFTAFAETMLRGRPELNLSPEIVLNERRFTGEDGLTEDPRYQFTLPKGFGEDDGATGKSGGASVRSQLADCANMDEVFEVVKGMFSRNFLHVRCLIISQMGLPSSWQPCSRLPSVTNGRKTPSILPRTILVSTPLLP